MFYHSESSSEIALSFWFSGVTRPIVIASPMKYGSRDTPAGRFLPGYLLALAREVLLLLISLLLSLPSPRWNLSSEQRRVKARGFPPCDSETSLSCEDVRKSPKQVLDSPPHPPQRSLVVHLPPPTPDLIWAFTPICAFALGYSSWGGGGWLGSEWTGLRIVPIT